jgi:hypothetical protein
MSKQDEWIEHDGKGFPSTIGNDEKIQRKYRDGLVGQWRTNREAQNLEMWTHKDDDSDIVAYRVVKP